MKFNIPQKYRIGTLLYQKKFTVVLSVVLAFALWLGIAMTENPIREKTFTDLSANVTLENTAAANLGLGIISDAASQKFSVTVSGPNYVISSLRAEDFMLSASTVDINAAGTFNLEVVAASDGSKSGFTITSISPSTIDVSVDFIDTKEYTLVPKLIGVTAAEGLIAEEPVVSNLQQSSITIKGPRSVIERIASVGTLAEVNSTLNASQIFNSDIVLYDANNEVLYRYTADGSVYDAKDNLITNSYLSLSFTTAKVTQPISKKKTVNCVAVFNNMPSGITEKNITHKLSKNKITVIGTPEIVDKLESVSLSAINFRDISTSSNSFEVTPSLPDGVRITENIDFITVDIDVSNYAEASFDIKNIRSLGLGSNLKAKTDKSIRVKLCGPKDVIEGIDASNLFAVVDLTDKNAGDYTVEAVVKSDVYNDVWQIGNYSTSVKLY